MVVIPELSLALGGAVVCAIIALFFLINGLRYTFPDEIVIGIVFLLIAWWLV